MTALRLLAVLALFAQPVAPPGGEAAGGEADRGAAASASSARLRVQKSKPSLLGGAGRAVSQALRRLWERDEPAAAEGNARVAQNDVPGALRAYAEAETRVPKASDAAAALALNRSGALLKLGAEQAPLALEQASRALSSTDPATRALAAYDAALALESAGKTGEAIAAYGRALALDDHDEDAKVNLELLLRAEERKKKQPAVGAQDEKQKEQQQGDSPEKSQAKDDKGDAPQRKEPPAAGEPPQADPRNDARKQASQKPNDGRPQDAGDEKARKERAQEQKEPKNPRGGEGEPGKPPPPRQPEAQDPGEQARAAARGGAQPLDRSEAQRLLDALRASEKNLQAWRFGKRTQDLRRRAPQKDW